MKIRFLYDNKPALKGYRFGWGLSIIIHNDRESIIFDFADDYNSLKYNLFKSGVETKSIKYALFSHYHKDHTGGYKLITEDLNDLDIYLPEVFPEEFKRSIAKSGDSLHQVSEEPIEITKNIWVSPVFKGINGPSECSLILLSKDTSAIITGCAHPGILNIRVNPNCSVKVSEQPIPPSFLLS